jgi:hypothetical protein
MTSHIIGRIGEYELRFGIAEEIGVAWRLAIVCLGAQPRLCSRSLPLPPGFSFDCRRVFAMEHGDLFSNFTEQELAERHHCCGFRAASLKLSIQASWILAGCWQSCDVCGLRRPGSFQSMPTWRPNWPWPRH